MKITNSAGLQHSCKPDQSLPRKVKGTIFLSFFKLYKRNLDQASPMATSNYITKVAIVGVRKNMLSSAPPAYRLTNTGWWQLRQLHDCIPA